jgi:hypothetical protein
MRATTSIHEEHSSPAQEALYNGLARKTLYSSHFSIAQQIGSGIATLLELRSEDHSSSMYIAA